MTPEELSAATGCGPRTAARYAGPITKACLQYAINTPKRLAAFVAQIAHESGNFSITEENLNYSAAGLRLIWPNRFSAAEAAEYAHKPEQIGDRAYGGRMGNGPEGTGDGFRYRGRGLLQLTGKDDYRDCGAALCLDLLEHPEILNEPEAAALAAAWEWSRSNLNPLADKMQFEAITLRINGGLNGQAARARLYERSLQALAGMPPHPNA